MFLTSSEQSGTRLDDIKQWFVDVFSGGGGRTAAGTRMNAQKTLSISAVFRAIDNLAGHIAMLPFPVIQRGKDAKGREIRNRLIDDPLDDLLNLRASAECRSFDFKRSLFAHMLLYGNGFAEIERDETLGEPVALYNLEPWLMEAKRDEDGGLHYIHRVPGGEPRRLEINDVLHISGLSNDGVMGHVVHQMGRENFGLILAIERFAATFFGNGGMPRIVFEYAGNFGKNEEKRKSFASSFDKAYRGANANKSAVLENGMTAKVVSAPNDDSQMLESRQFGVKDVCRWFNMPPHLLFELTDATYNNIDQMSRGYVIYSMGTIIKPVEEEFIYKLINPIERRTRFVEINVEGLLRGDTKTRYEAHKSAIEAGWKSRNEVRQLENMNPEDGLDAFMEPLNHAPAGSRAADAPTKPGKPSNLATAPIPGTEEPWLPRATASAMDEPKDDIVSASASLVREAWNRVNRRISGRAARAAKTPESFNDWIDGLPDREQETISGIVRTPTRVLNSCLSRPMALEATVEKYLKWISGELLALSNSKPDELLAAVEAWAEQFKDE